LLCCFVVLCAEQEDGTILACSPSLCTCNVQECYDRLFAVWTRYASTQVFGVPLHVLQSRHTRLD
jgi:hypothetical protein